MWGTCRGVHMNTIVGHVPWITYFSTVDYVLWVHAVDDILWVQSVGVMLWVCPSYLYSYIFTCS